MQFIMINNLTKNTFGIVDYKGLDVDSFVAGSQFYKGDMSYCVLATEEDVVSEEISADIIVLTETEYQNEKSALEIGSQQTPVPADADRIAQLEAMVTTASQKYDALNKEATPLKDLKATRISKLKEECTAAIYEGFTSGQYEFSFNEQDQVNFTQRMLTVINGAAGPFEWKTKNAGVISLTKEEFIMVINDAETHKLTQQRKYWLLEQQVIAAETNATVDAVKW